jgi:hypothetical protein
VQQLICPMVAIVLVRVDHIASVIANANHGVM